MIACIGGDTNHQQGFKDLVANFSHFSNQGSYPYGAAGPNMPFSLITQHYMDNYNATREDFGQIAVSQRYNANHYDQALLGGKPLDMQQYLDARAIAGPLHLFDCVMPCAGGEGLLLMSTERAKATGLPWVEILAAAECHNAYQNDAVQYRAGWELFADDLYEQASVAPEDMDLLQTYDDYPVISILQMEGLGFCKQGEAAQFVRETALTFDGGGLPHNTSGGQLSVGQAGAAAGFMGLVEAIRQLNGTAGANQVEGASLAMGERLRQWSITTAGSALRPPFWAREVHNEYSPFFQRLFVFQLCGQPIQSAQSEQSGRRAGFTALPGLRCHSVPKPGALP